VGVGGGDKEPREYKEFRIGGTSLWQYLISNH
jgi:hypothetical protein